jgi:hypothetical protein
MIKHPGPWKIYQFPEMPARNYDGDVIGRSFAAYDINDVFVAWVTEVAARDIMNVPLGDPFDPPERGSEQAPNKPIVTVAKNKKILE